jgi:ATP-dependent exoDNAse (exonuclease V) beta subunit
LAGAAVGEILRLGTPIAVHGRPPMNVVGTACNEIIAALLLGSRSAKPVGWAEELLKRYQVDASLTAGAVVRQTLALQALLVEKFGARELLPEWPVSITLDNGQMLHGWIDLLVRTREGWLIIDHKAYPGHPSGWGEYALGDSGQLAAYRQAVEQATGIPVVGQWLHLCLGGGMVEVKFPG